MLELVNIIQAKGCNCGEEYKKSVGPLKWNIVLAKAVYNHALDMSENDFFSHTGSNGESVSDRIEPLGYNWTSCGENIGVGYPTPMAATEGWLNSPGHCGNIMKKDFAGIGVAYIPKTKIWVQVFARPSETN